MKISKDTRADLSIEPGGDIELTIEQNEFGDFRKSDSTQFVILQGEEVLKLKKLLERIV